MHCLDVQVYQNFTYKIVPERLICVIYYLLTKALRTGFVSETRMEK
jgi:hypothetical protein